VASLAARFGHPEWLVERWLEAYGPEATEAVLRAGNETPTLWLRPVPGRLEVVSRELRKRDVPHEVDADADPGAIRLLEPAGLVPDLPGFRKGWFVVQDRSAMRAVEVLAPEPGEKILDLCAAPGGKTTHVAHLVGPEGRVVALDRDEKRLAKLGETIDRLKIENVSVVVADAADEALAVDGAPFDRVLADVPCSNTAVLAKRAEARHRVTPELVETLAAVQRRILETAVRHVKPGGVVAYSTCALTDEENAGLVEAAIEDGLPLEIEEERETRPRAGYSDGGYVVRLRHIER
jgi:16S rRNA (cytosine967-C5)-methyltransferase